MASFTITAALGEPASTSTSIPAPKNAAHFFGPTNVWKVHLEVNPLDWRVLASSRSATYLVRGPAGAPAVPNPGPAGEARQPGSANAPQAVRSQSGFTYVPANVEIAGQRLEKVGLRLKGHSSLDQTQGSLKKPFKLDFNRFVKGQKFLGLTKINLNNNAMDPAQIREALAYDIFRTAGVDSSRTAFAEVYLTVPGVYDRQYLGFYTVVEQVDGKFLEDRFGSQKGLLVKPEVAPGLRYLGEDWSAYRKPYEAKNEPTPEDARRFIQFIKLMTCGDEEAFRSRLEEFTDVNQFLRLLAVTVTVADMDSVLSLGHNFYLFQPAPPKKIVWIPWDLNLSLGSGGQGMELSIRNLTSPHTRVIDWILKDERWFDIYRGHLQSILDSAFQPDRVLRLMEQMRAAVRDSIALESQRSLINFENAVLGRTASDSGPVNRSTQAAGQPGGPNSAVVRAMVAGMDRAQSPLTVWVKKRAESIASQLAGLSAGKPLMGGLAMFGGRRSFGPGGRLAEQFFRDGGLKPDAKLTSDDFKQSVRQWFQRLDTDRSGTLNEAEMILGLSPAFGPPPEILAQMPAPLRPPPVGPQRILGLQWLRRIDTDRNSAISPAEWEKTFARYFDEWDTNRDSALDTEEIGRGFGQALTPSSEPMFPGGAGVRPLPPPVNGPVPLRPNPR